MTASSAVAVAIAHINAWSHHRWDQTRELLAPDIHAVVASTQGAVSELSGVDEYMLRKIKGAQLVEPGSVEVVSAIGDRAGALVTITFRVRLGTMVTMARACAYLIDDDHKIKEERDVFFVLSDS